MRMSPVRGIRQIHAAAETTTVISGAQLAAAMVAGTQLRLGPGHHRVTGKALVLAPTSGFSLTGAGMDKTFLHFDTKAPIDIQQAATATNLKISDVSMVSDVVSSELTYLGIITTRANLNNWKLERVRFSSPANNENAIKLMTGAGRYIRNIKILDCEFIDIANMGVEIWGDAAPLDTTNVDLVRCLFEDVSSVAGLPISLVSQNQKSVRVVDCILESCYSGIELSSGVHVDNVEFRFARRNYNPIMVSSTICDSIISNCREQSVYGEERSGLWQVFGKRLRISNCNTNSSLQLRGADLDLEGSTFRGIDFADAPSRVNMSNNTIGVLGSSATALYAYPEATGSVVQGTGNRIKATALLNDPTRITSTDLTGTLVGFN